MVSCSSSGKFKLHFHWAAQRDSSPDVMSWIILYIIHFLTCKWSIEAQVQKHPKSLSLYQNVEKNCSLWKFISLLKLKCKSTLSLYQNVEKNCSLWKFISNYIILFGIMHDVILKWYNDYSDSLPLNQKLTDKKGDIVEVHICQQLFWSRLIC